MLKLVKKLYEIAGEESKKISRMLIFEILKSIFEGVMLGSVMLLLYRVFQNLFEHRPIIRADILLVFAVALFSVIGKIFCAYKADCNKYIAAYRIGAENRLTIGDKLKHVYMGYFNANRLGDISGGLTTVIGDLETVGITIIETLFVGVIQTAIMALFMLPFDFLSGLIILVTLALGIFSNSFFQKKEDQLTKQLQKLKLNLNAKTLEYVKGISVIKSFGKGEKMRRELDDSISENREGFLKVEKTVSPALLLSLGIFKVGTCLIVLSTVFRFCSGQLEPYKAVMLIVASFIVFAGFEMAESMQNVRGIAIQNLDAISKLRDLPVIAEGTKDTMNQAEIKVEHLDFSYDEKPLFKNINLRIPEGKTTAIIGSSGSGKTTLCNLIARFWDADHGQVKIDGADVKDYQYDALLSNFSFVFQNVYLFEDTVKNNIKFGNPNATDEEVINAAKNARCHDFIMALPQGYNTMLQEGGTNLSGGEKQRLSIARAMLKPSRIVILDEATSSIDPENEEQLNLALKHLLSGKTVLVIAHKLETIRSADHIVVLDHGSVESCGTHQELLQKSAIYQHFLSQREKAMNWKIDNNS